MERKGRSLFTSESVTEGHPDKIADQISDAILDAVLEEDPMGRVACETFVTTGLVFIGGQITTDCYVDFPQIARNTVREVGYTNASYGFDYDTCAVISSIEEQSPDIAQGVDTGGAGDQGMMFGFACLETPELMPLPIMIAHRLVRRLADCRKNDVLDFLRPDGKSQVTVEYEGDRAVRVDNIIIAAQHSEDVKYDDLVEGIKAEVIKPIVPSDLLDHNTTYHINRTGRFFRGGPQADTGLTGRKIIVDTYGGVGHHGGGCFSGKDPTKVDRSASYMARYIAKNIVAAGIADRFEIQLAYVIGEPDPVSIMVNSFGTGKISEDKMIHLVREHFNMTPRAIIDYLKLRKPIYRKTASYGHFGREEEGFTWEVTNMAETLRKQAGL